MTFNTEVYTEAWNLLQKIKNHRTEERSEKARFYNASQKSLEDFVAYFRTFVLTMEEIDESEKHRQDAQSGS